ncbi:rubrerythrin family protein [Halorarius litoreus]|uniref:rubrerythrin family protein n=1 Tax=Halorarius litoreus TaxID=2962676 RepID=UPI0020CD31AC|nr:rubrerythrin family protein [Halorarius litoreus]
MNGQEVVDAVNRDRATELDRLGSGKALVAATTANLDREPVLTAAAQAEARAHETFETWATDEPDAAAREAFADVADTEADHHAQVVALLDDAPDAPEPDALHEYLRGLDDTAERVGAGLVGRPLASSRSLLQVVNFFVNEAARAEADLFRELRSDSDATVERGIEVLDAVCADDAAYERAQAAAEAAIDTAYEEYATQLEVMGLDPKPVC